MRCRIVFFLEWRRKPKRHYIFPLTSPEYTEMKHLLSFSLRFSPVTLYSPPDSIYHTTPETRYLLNINELRERDKMEGGRATFYEPGHEKTCFLHM